MIASIVSKYKNLYELSGTKNMRENKIKNFQGETEILLEKIKNFNPDSCYDFSVMDEESDGSQTANVTLKSIVNNIQLTKNNEIIDCEKKSLNTYNLKFSDVIEKQGIKGRKIYQLKKYIKLIDLFASIMIISGCVLSLVEHESYFFDNLKERIEGISLMNDMIKQNGSLANLNISNYEISYLMNNNYTLNITEYQQVPISLSISEYCQTLRIYICIFSLLSVPLIIFGRYLDFIREKLYIEKFTGII